MNTTVTVKVQWGSKGTREVLHEETIEAESIEAAREWAEHMIHNLFINWQDVGTRVLPSDDEPTA